jgi:hypothetical protein
MSAPGETPLEDLKNALQLLYEVKPADDKSRLYLCDGRQRVIAAIRKLDVEPPRAATSLEQFYRHRESKL